MGNITKALSSIVRATIEIMSATKSTPRPRKALLMCQKNTVL